MVCCVDLQWPGRWRVEHAGHSFLLIESVLYCSLEHKNIGNHQGTEFWRTNEQYSDKAKEKNEFAEAALYLYVPIMLF